MSQFKLFIHKVNAVSAVKIGIIAGLASVFIGAIAFALSWNIWGGGMPGYRIFVFPGNFVLSFFSEEINFWPKLLLMLSGQFILVSLFFGCLQLVYKKLSGSKKINNQ